MGEVGHAVTRAGITLDEANTLIKQLYARYAHVFAAKAGNPGVLFEKVYEMDILTSLPAWQKM